MMINFNPAPDSHGQPVLIEKSEIKYISTSNIGPRNEQGPFFEFTVYCIEHGKVFTFGDFLCSEKEEFNKLCQSLDITPQDKHVCPYGWTWGDLHIDSRIISLQDPKFDDDLESSTENDQIPSSGAQEPENEQENVEEPSDVVETEYFHMPSQLVTDYQKLGAKDLQIEFRDPNIQNVVAVRAMTFGFPSEEERDQLYSDLARAVTTTSTERILLLENFQLFQPAGKYNLEFGPAYFKFSAAREIQREGRDVMRMYLLEKNEEDFFLVLQLLQSRKIGDSDMIVLELTQKRENRDLLLPADEQEQEKLIVELQLKGFGEMTFNDEQNEPYGPDCLVERSLNAEKKNTVRLRSVPQFVIVFKMLKHMCRGANIVMSDIAEGRFFNEAAHIRGFAAGGDMCFVKCGYKRPQRDYQMYILQKAIIVLPVDSVHLNFADISLVQYEKDQRHSIETRSLIKMTVVCKQTRYEFTKMDPEDVAAIAAYLKKKSLPGLSIVDQYFEKGGRQRAESQGEGDDEDDESWEESKESTAASYEFSSKADEVVSEKSEDKKKKKEEEKPKPKKAEKPQKQVFEVLDGVRPEDALREVGWPAEWAGATLDAGHVADESITGESD